MDCIMRDACKRDHFQVFREKNEEMFGSLAENVYLCTRKTDNDVSIINMVPVVQLVRASDCGSA